MSKAYIFYMPKLCTLFCLVQIKRLHIFASCVFWFVFWTLAVISCVWLCGHISYVLCLSTVSKTFNVGVFSETECLCNTVYLSIHSCWMWVVWAWAFLMYMEPLHFISFKQCNEKGIISPCYEETSGRRLVFNAFSMLSVWLSAPHSHKTCTSLCISCFKGFFHSLLETSFQYERRGVTRKISLQTAIATILLTAIAPILLPSQPA